MSSTRRAKDPSTLYQFRYASAPEYIRNRGIEGGTASQKACLVTQRERELIFFLVSHSRFSDCKSDLPGLGLDRLVDELIRLVPEDFGTELMRRNPMPKGGVYSESDAEQIECELRRSSEIDPVAGAWRPKRDEDPDPVVDEVIYLGTGELRPAVNGSQSRRAVPRETLLEQIHERARRELPRLITELCVRPSLAVIPEVGLSKHRQNEGMEVCRIPYLWDLGATLERFKNRYNRQVRSGFCETSVAEVLFPEFEYALKSESIVLIEGDSGVGKSSAALAWVDRNRHRARYISLPGICSKGAFSHCLAEALGLPKSDGISVSKRLVRIGEVMKASRLMLVIDEAQHLFPATSRPEHAPELIEWVRTRCPFGVALLTTSEWHRRQANVERHTTWASEQLRRRCRLKNLPKPTVDDLWKIATANLPGVDERVLEASVRYAGRILGISPTRLMDLIKDAKSIAREAGHEVVTIEDLAAAARFRTDSDAFMMRTPEPAPGRRTRRSTPEPSESTDPAAPEQEPCIPDAGLRQTSFETPDRGFSVRRETHLTPAA